MSSDRKAFLDFQVSQILDQECFNNVRDLYLGFSDLGDSNTVRFLSTFPDLESPDIDTNVNITDAFLEAIVEAPKAKIKEIWVNECEGVARDTVKWAKPHGVKMKWSSGF